MIHWFRVVRDALGIALLVGVGGLLVSSFGGAGEGGIPMPQVAVSNFLLALIGFVIAGAMTREFRGRHLFGVAFGVWLLGFTSVCCSASR